MTWVSIWKLAALAGVPDPGPYQIWQLRAMAEQKQELHWQMIGEITYTIAQSHAGKKRLDKTEFNPMLKKRKESVREQFEQVRESGILPEKLTEAEKEKIWEAHKW